MKWSSRYEPVGRKPSRRAKDTRKRVLAYFSDCTRYATLRIKQGQYRLTESDGCGSMYWVTLDKGKSEFTTLAAAKAQAEVEETVRLRIWHYFMAISQRRHAADARTRANPGKACGLVESEVAERADWTVEQYANHSYAYAKDRANMRTDARSFAWSKYIDPAARRDWQAMLDGTYKQWWERETA